MAYVYILESQRDSSFYIGSTLNLDRRLKEYKEGMIISTKGRLPIRLVFYEEYLTLSLAKKIESRLKNLKRRDYIVKIIEDGYIKMRP